MKVSILSQNLQGLNDVDKVARVINYMRKFLGSTHFLCFQEHKLRGARLFDLRDKIWATADFYFQEASLGYNNELGEEGAGCGGVCMWIAPSIKHLVAASGQSRSGSAQWVRLKRLPGGDVAILNIYAPNRTQDRCEL